MKIGIIQGRLSEPTEGFQECPRDWKREFDLLPELGLNHIEWIITSDNFHNNPIFHEDLSGYPISSVCADFMVNDKFYDFDYLNNFFKTTCEAIIHHKIGYVTVPLMEKSNVDNDEVMDIFVDAFYPYAKEFNNLNFLIEAELNQNKLKKILDLSNNLVVTYDTGNITSCRLSHKDYIFELNNKIKQVHIKDRTINPLKTVEPTTGDTDFNLVFDCLNKINFDGLYTLQTARCASGDEINTIKKHKKTIEDLYEGQLV